MGTVCSWDHSSKLPGHPGVQKTLVLISCNYYGLQLLRILRALWQSVHFAPKTGGLTYDQTVCYTLLYSYLPWLAATTVCRFLYAALCSLLVHLKGHYAPLFSFPHQCPHLVGYLKKHSHSARCLSNRFLTLRCFQIVFSRF